MKTILAALSMLVIASPFAALADEPLTFYTEHFPPYNYVGATGVTGLNTELLSLACNKAELVCHFELYPWLRAYENASKNPHGGLFSTSRNTHREHSFKWVGPLAHSTANMYRLKSRPEVNPHTLEDAKHFVVGVASGDIYEQYLLDQGFSYSENLLRLAAKASAVKLFLQSKVDLLIASELILPIWFAGHGVNVNAVEPVLDLSGIDANYLALNLAVPDAVVKKLQLALEEIKAGEQYKLLKEKYMRPAAIIE